MSPAANLAIGIGMFARCLVSCDACLLTAKAAAAEPAQVRWHRPHRPDLALRRPPASLSQDPARARREVRPLPRAQYEVYPLSS